MSEQTFHADALIAAMGPMIGVEVDATSHPVVKMHLETAVRLARLVLDFPLDDEAEPAATFVP
jgi:hypothetical protein